MSNNKPTVVVAGIGRSGLTVTMQMLHAGGYPCAGQPPGFEIFDIGMIPWKRCMGDAVKLVGAHLQLPPPGNYAVIRLKRNFNQQALSVRKFWRIFGLPDESNNSALIRSFKKDYKVIDGWAKSQRTLMLDFEEIITDAITTAEKIREFIGEPLDTAKMASVVIPRDSDCHPEMLELSMIHRSAV